MTPGGSGTSGRKVFLSISLAGLLSALCTVFFTAIGPGVYLAGFFFGAGVTLPLIRSKILNQRPAFYLLTVVIFAQLSSVLAAFFVQSHLTLPNAATWSMGHTETLSPISLFVGGLVGGFLVFGEALYLLHRGIGWGPAVTKAFMLALVAGALGVIGWALGPSLGTVITRLCYAAHLSATAPSPYDPLSGYREPAVEYSLYLVWQTGVGVILGMLVRPTDRNLG